MTDLYFFDTDCISAFLWVKKESILAELYPRKIILPRQVYDEITKVPPLLNRINGMKDAGQLTVKSIDVGTDEFSDYYALAVSPPAGERIIGKGEAAAIALTKKHNGTLASNNLRDIKRYINQFKLKHVTTGDILVGALNQGLISEEEGNILWADMTAKRRMLPTPTFTEFMEKYKM